MDLNPGIVTVMSSASTYLSALIAIVFLSCPNSVLSSGSSESSESDGWKRQVMSFEVFAESGFIATTPTSCAFAVGISSSRAWRVTTFRGTSTMSNSLVLMALTRMCGLWLVMPMKSTRPFARASLHVWSEPFAPVALVSVFSSSMP